MQFELPKLNVPKKISGKPIRLLQYNVALMEAGAGKILKAFEDSKADIALMQEAFTPGKPVPNAELMVAFSKYHTYIDESRMVVSKFPILKGRRLQSGDSKSHRGVQVWINVNGVKTQVVSVHLLPQAPTGLNFLKTKISNAELSKARYQQYRTLLNVIGKEPRNLIIAGDFNTIPLSPEYPLTAKKMKDAFVERSWGWGHTFPNKFPVGRIDYIWVSPDYEVLSSSVKDFKVSDHRAIVAKIGRLAVGPKPLESVQKAIKLVKEETQDHADAISSEASGKEQFKSFCYLRYIRGPRYDYETSFSRDRWPPQRWKKHAV